MSKEKVILAYSGGLDTSVAITWLMKDYDVVAVCMDCLLYTSDAADD